MLSNFPFDIIKTIAVFLNYFDLTNLRLVNKKLAQDFLRDDLFNFLIVRKYSKIPDKTPRLEYHQLEQHFTTEVKESGFMTYKIYKPTNLDFVVGVVYGFLCLFETRWRKGINPNYIRIYDHFNNRVIKEDELIKLIKRYINSSISRTKVISWNAGKATVSTSCEFMKGFSDMMEHHHRNITA